MDIQTRVIIIDDNKDISQVFGMALADEGYKVTIVNNPNVVIDLMDLCDYDVVIVDYMMPGEVFKNGGSLVEYVKEKCCHKNILLVTGENVERANGHGVPVLLKPVRMSDLVAAVGYLARRQRVA